MKTNNIDMFVFVKSSGQADQRSKVVDIVNSLSGITVARMHPRINRLVEISYNPEDVSSMHIINSIRKKGYPSALIGM